MSSKFVTEDKHTAAKAYGANHTEWGTLGRDIEYQWWKNSQAKTAIPWGTDRASAITAAAAGFSITLPALDGKVGPFQREQSFWAQYAALPPTPLP